MSERDELLANLEQLRKWHEHLPAVRDKLAPD